MANQVRFAAVGAGFWARYQLAAWKEVPGVECVAICDQQRPRAEALAQSLGIAKVYQDVEEMLERERPQFLDIITTEETHAPLVRLAARHQVPVICQKPMAPTLELAREMVRTCQEARVPFAVHENYRFQAPMRAVKRALDQGIIGRPYRGRIQAITGFPVFANQPNLKQLERFLLTDMGSHTLDLARYFFGEGDRLFCTTSQIHDGIKGEDVATVMIRTKSQATVSCVMALAETPIEVDHFPEVLVFIEGSRGTLEVSPGCRVRVTTSEGTTITAHEPKKYPWANRDYLVSNESMVACNQDLLEGMLGRKAAQTQGEDNLKTVEMVFSAYESARTGEAVRLGLQT